MPSFKAAVLLAGNGVYDGSETTEAVSTLVALAKHQAEIQCFAPNEDQFHVINHTNGEELPEKRNVLVESARIARGNVKDIKELSAQDYDALFVPGGFGAGKNLSTFATKGAEMTVHAEVERVLKDFHAKGKHIALCCISPVIAARVFGSEKGGPGATLTLGCKGDEKAWPYAGSIDAATSFGNKLEEKTVDKICYDDANKITTAPAYMYGTANPAEVYESVRGMVDSVAQKIQAATSSHPVVLHVKIEVNPEKLEEFMVALKADCVGSRQEPGCLRFDITRNPGAPHKIQLYEAYKSPADVEFHKQQDYFKAMGAFTKESGHIVDISLETFEAVDFTA